MWMKIVIQPWLYLNNICLYSWDRTCGTWQNLTYFCVFLTPVLFSRMTRLSMTLYHPVTEAKLAFRYKLERQLPRALYFLTMELAWYEYMRNLCFIHPIAWSDLGATAVAATEYGRTQTLHNFNHQYYWPRMWTSCGLWLWAGCTWNL